MAKNLPCLNVTLRYPFGNLQILVCLHNAINFKILYHSKRQEYYSSADKNYLAQIIKDVDPNGMVLFSAKKDGGTSKQKAQ